jgi:hypothetical protein
MTKSFALAALLCLAAASARAQEWQKLAGAQTGVSGARTVVIKTEAEWAALWTAHAGQAKAAPRVDFSKEMVVGVFLGEHKHAGCAVELKLVEIPSFVDEQGAQEDTLLVIYREKTAGDGVSAAVLTAPFALAKVRRHAAVEFQRDAAIRALEKMRELAQAPRFDH